MQGRTGDRIETPVTIVHGRGATVHAAAEQAAVERDLLRRPPRIDCRYFYDDAGMQLFEEITRLPEYYQTRTEEALLAGIADEVIAGTAARELVELGSGSGRKIRFLLDAMQCRDRLESCVLLDINETVLRTSAAALAERYPGLAVRGVVGDFHHDLEAVGRGGPRLFILLAGTIGNLDRPQLATFLHAIRAILGPDDVFLVGLDLVKDPARLVAAYDDRAGVTARFNLNILKVLNRRFGFGFTVDDFAHVAIYDPEHAWIEMRLRAVRATAVALAGGRTLRFAAGDEIRTEISRKFTRDSFVTELVGVDLALAAWFTDPQGLFASALVRPGSGGFGP